MKLVPRGLRAQLTISAALLVLVVSALAGLTMVLGFDHRDRADVDRQLSARAEKVREDLGKLLSDRDRDEQHADDYGDLLAGSQSLVRIISAGQIVVQRGDRPVVPVPVPATGGFSTITAGGQTWRSLVQPLDQAGFRLQVLQDLTPVEQRLTANTRLVSVISILAPLITAAGAWFVTRAILTPLERLRAGALRVRSPQRLPQVARPREVADLSTALNTMLAQLHTSMQATRRFTADAGHELRTPLTGLGVNLETLRRNPSLPAVQRQAALDAMATEHHRITALLDGLQSLARGDAGALPASEDVDLADLLDEAVRHARHRHPGTDYRRAGHGEPIVHGWPAGLRLAIDNLLDNAALHGREGGNVDVRLTLAEDTAELAVIDDGPGIPESRREAMKERFTRGPHPRGEGSGLGLALVQQQADLHHGTLTLAQAPAGGLHATLTLPRTT